jgi:hypothetical protein
MFIAQLNEDSVIDQIPLAEVQLVREMDNMDGEDKEANVSNNLMIETHPEGYNSGRTYYFQANSKASCQEIVRKLSQYCTAAHERAHTRTVFAQAQRQVDKVYRSPLFQGFFAFLIIAVSRCCVSKDRRSCWPWPFLMLAHQNAELHRVRAGRAIQAQQLGGLRRPGPPHQLHLLRHLRRRAGHQPLRQLAGPVRPQRVELARCLHRPHLIRGLWVPQSPGLDGAADAGHPSRPAFRESASADQNDLGHHCVALPHDERLRHPQHRPQHLYARPTTADPVCPHPFSR